MKILINDCYGGFWLSDEAVRRFTAQTGRTIEPFTDSYRDRTDPVLIAIVEDLGVAASTHASRIIVREVPKGTRYRLREYDGSEIVEVESGVQWQVAT